MPAMILLTPAMIVLTAVSLAAAPAAAWIVPAWTSLRAAPRAAPLVAIRTVEQGAGADGRGGYLGLRVHRAGGRHAPQNRAVVRISEPDNAFGTDSDPVYTPGANKSPVRASDILKYPGILFMPQDRMPPGHA